MTAVEAYRQQAEFAFRELVGALEGVSQAQAWSVLPEGGLDYLHTDASIHGITLHIASGKMMFGSVGFRNTEIRWRDVAVKIEAFEPDWDAAKAFLHETHAYWMDSWSAITDEQLGQNVRHPQGRVMTAAELIAMNVHHDGYHGGQIALLRYAVGETDQKPPSQAEDIRKYCPESVSW